MPRRDVWADWQPPDRSAAPVAMPHFPMGGTPFAPESACPHRGAYPSYSHLVCMCCQATGDVLGHQASRHRLPPQIKEKDGYGPFGKPIDGVTFVPEGRTAKQIKADARKQRVGGKSKVA